MRCRPESAFREAVIPVPAPGGPAPQKGRFAERQLVVGCHAREIRFWIGRRLRSSGKGGQPCQPLELASKPRPGPAPADSADHSSQPLGQAGGGAAPLAVDAQIQACDRAIESP